MAALRLLASQLLAALLLAASCQRAGALDNGAGRLPALGWSSWNLLGNRVNEALILEVADALVDTGLSKLGFRYVNVDAGAILRGRHPATGKPVVDSHKFPRGMRAVADAIHAKGLLLGVYTDISSHSCGTGPSSRKQRRLVCAARTLLTRHRAIPGSQVIAAGRARLKSSSLFATPGGERGLSSVQNTMHPRAIYRKQQIHWR